MTGTSLHVSRVLARDDLLQLAADADDAVGIVRQRESLARSAERGLDVFAVALRHYLNEVESRRWAIRAQAWSYAATIVCFCDLVGIPIETPYSAQEMYASAARELTENVVDGRRLDQDLTLGVFNTHRRARNLRLTGRYAEALNLVVVPPTDLFGTGAEPHWGHYLFEFGACLISNGQAAQVPDALGEQRQYWERTRAAGFSTRHRFDFVLALAEWERGEPAEALCGLRMATDRLGTTDRTAGPAAVDSLRASLDEARDVQRLSVTLGLAEALALGEPTEARLREVVDLGGQALEVAEQIRGRWRVIARSRTPLAVAFRRIYGDIALLASRLPGPDAAALGFRVALSAKQTGFASRVREGRLLMSPHVGGLLDEIVDLEDPPVETLTSGDRTSRDEKLEQLRVRIEEEVSPMLADTVLPVPTELHRLVDLIGERHAVDFVALPDTLSGHRKNWFRAIIQPNRPIGFERFEPGPAYTAFFEGSEGSVGSGSSEGSVAGAAGGDSEGSEGSEDSRRGQAPWLDRLERATTTEQPDWQGLAHELLPAALLAEVRARTVTDPVELLISGHSALSLLPWAALRIDDAGTPLVERAVIAQCPTLTCLSYRRPPVVTGPALVRLVSVAEGGVNIDQERLAWDLGEERGRVRLSRCAADRASSPVALDADVPAALADSTAGWGFVHVAAHGGGQGLGQYLQLPRELTAAQALGMKWPASVLMASCHVGRLVNPEDAEPLSFVMALLTGGSRCVVAGMDWIPDVWTGRAAGRIVDAVRDGSVRLDVALRAVQLGSARQPNARWALLSAYVR
ncbi:hypothetical protein GCM10027280_31000 [Micromonospora polyrhachis]|uniref:CHAT domain-containing protein n=1 Tax=Micromonospora polyrhachis TaxID=1282883 RepID=A0A7W7WS85_9ACTN|nr:CHAT domain-containing protein [Micromonospora polyrhachis]MBB4961128.1 hypothetical protein [Micromonospora polyrhachis]